MFFPKVFTDFILEMGKKSQNLIWIPRPVLFPSLYLYICIVQKEKKKEAKEAKHGRIIKVKGLKCIMLIVVRCL